MPGRYLSEDVNAGEMLARGWCRVQGYGLSNGSSFRAFSQKEDYNDTRLLFVRPGGFGDLLFLTPTFREIKKRWPRANIFVSCFDRYWPALVNNPDVAGFIPYPVSLELWDRSKAHVWLENIIERNTEAREMHAVDVIAKRVGIEFEDKTMKYIVSPEEKIAAEREFPRVIDAKVRVGLQMTASGSCRVYPFMADLSKRLWRDRGYEVFLFGKPGDVMSDEPAGMVNLMLRGKTFRESCAVLQTCDVVVAPDSALAHVAGALGVPCVALYGPFPWKLRTAYAPETFALQGTCPVSPCFHHGQAGQGFPENGPCAQTGRCEALAAITVDRVMRAVEKRLEK